MTIITNLINEGRIYLHGEDATNIDPAKADIIWCADPVAHKALVEYMEDNSDQNMVDDCGHYVHSWDLPRVGFYGISYSYRKYDCHNCRYGYQEQTEAELHMTYMVATVIGKEAQRYV